MNEIRVDDNLLALENWYKSRSKVLIALSGGVDSCLVAYTARKWLGKQNAIAVISNSASLKAKDLEDAKAFCSSYDIKLEIVDAKEINDPNYASNPIDRCYFCKTALYDELFKLVESKYKGYQILNGNNFSDFGDYRPGLKAADEHKVLSPLADTKFTKEDIRLVAKHFDIFVWDKPASPCLSSRFPYGESITIEKLRMVEEAENTLNDYGFEDVRVRYMNHNAKIEVPHNELDRLYPIMEEISMKFKLLGFREINVDVEGLISGKLNRAINNG
jgi:uncharacterized protein